MQPATEYLRARYQPEDHLVVTLNSWAFGLDFYTRGLVDNPRFPANQGQLAQNGDVNAVCRNKWLVEDGWAQGVSALLDEAIQKCPYRTAFRYPAPTYEVGDDGRWGYILHDVVVYVRSDTASAPDR